MQFKTNVEIKEVKTPFRKIVASTLCDKEANRKELFLPVHEEVKLGEKNLPVRAHLAISKHGNPIILPGDGQGTVWIAVVHTGMYYTQTNKLWIDHASTTVDVKDTVPLSKFDFSEGRLIWMKRSRGEKLSSFGFVFYKRKASDAIVFRVGDNMSVEFSSRMTIRLENKNSSSTVIKLGNKVIQ